MVLRPIICLDGRYFSCHMYRRPGKFQTRQNNHLLLIVLQYDGNYEMLGALDSRVIVINQPFLLLCKKPMNNAFCYISAFIL